MYRRINYKKSKGITSVPIFVGERIEKKVERILNNKEPISDGAPIIYTEKGELNPAYDHRTDRWEIATENMSIVHKTESAKASVNPNTKIDANDTNNDLLSNPGGDASNAGGQE